jgi:hypothetical protein
MKVTTVSVLYAGVASAHYAIKSLVIDGNRYRHKTPIQPICLLIGL